MATAPIVPTTNPVANDTPVVATSSAVATSAAATTTAVVPTTSVAPTTSAVESSAAPVVSSAASSAAVQSSVTPSSSSVAPISTSTTPTTSSVVPTTSIAAVTTPVTVVTSSQSPSVKVVTVINSAQSAPGLITDPSVVTPSSTSVKAGAATDLANSKGGIGGSGLPVGGLVGIIIGALAVLAIIGLFVTRSMRKRARAKRTAHRSSLFEPWAAPGPVSMEDEPYEKPAYDAPAQSYPMQQAATDMEMYPESNYATYPAAYNGYNDYPQGYNAHGGAYPEQTYPDMGVAGVGAGVGAGAAGVGAAGAAGGLSAAAASGIHDEMMVRVKVAFVRSLEDELAITPGQQLYLHNAYDDGWTLCEDQAQNRGVVPLSCLEPWDESANENFVPPTDDQALSADATTQRRSSLYAPPQ